MAPSPHPSPGSRPEPVPEMKAPRLPESEARVLMEGRRLAEQLLGAAWLQLYAMAPSWQVQGDLGAQGERLWHDWPLMSLAWSSKRAVSCCPTELRMSLCLVYRP